MFYFKRSDMQISCKQNIVTLLVMQFRYLNISRGNEIHKVLSLYDFQRNNKFLVETFLEDFKGIEKMLTTIVRAELLNLSVILTKF